MKLDLRIRRRLTALLGFLIAPGIFLIGCGSSSGGGGNPGGAIAPSITSEPQNATVNAGQPAAFSVTATGTMPLTYAWTQNAAPVGTNSSSYTIAQATVADNGAKIQVTVSNAAGSKQSTIATSMVNQAGVAPVITTQPVSLAVNVGQTATFSVTATGTAS